MLDDLEQGFRRVAVQVRTANAARLTADTYEAELLTHDPVPFDWYRAYILEGAREHGLPEAYLRRLERLPFRSA